MTLLSTEPHQGDGGLLRGPHEAVRGRQDGAAHPQRARLYRLHAHALPELSTFTHIITYYKANGVFNLSFTYEKSLQYSIRFPIPF